MREMESEDSVTPEQLFSRGGIIQKAQEYVKACGEQEGGGRFPNLAGFACSIGVGVDALETLGMEYPTHYDQILTILEDGALNAAHIPAKSATLAVDYFRHRLGYGGKGEKDRAATGGTMCVSFDHNMTEDGG